MILMLMLGPLSGWYGPSIITQLRQLMVSETPRTQPMTPGPTVNAIRPQQLKLRRIQLPFDAVLRDPSLRRAPSLSRSLLLSRERDYRASQMEEGRNPRVNRNGARRPRIV
jgi:hypothetical protein